MAKVKSAWGIDIGQCALKAIKLRSLDSQCQVEALDIIEYPKILSDPEANHRQLIGDAMGKFLSRHSLLGSSVCIAAPGQTGFTRFVKLPPVEPKRIPDIVRFESEQQIPFPIDEVIWRWQTFANPNSPEMEVGIFAMKRIDVASVLDHFTNLEIDVDVVQMAPLALYNFMKYDDQISPEGATLLADIGADKTDLVVSDGSSIWTRTLQIGGNNFTQALVKAFKLSFHKAEKLKKTSASSKYARQIFQAMRPVFADLVQEIQRSVGYYTSLHRESRFRRMVGLGNGFRLPGLQKFLEQNLNMPVVRVDNYNKLRLSAQVSAPTFNENTLSFGVAYGLAIQGLGETIVQTNLLPEEITRKRIWAKKKPWFAASAAVVLLALGSMLYGVSKDISALKKGQNTLNQATSIVDTLEKWESDYKQVDRDIETLQQEIQQKIDLFAHGRFWPDIHGVIAQALLGATGEDQRLLVSYCDAAGAGAKKGANKDKVLQQICNKPRNQRQTLLFEQMQTEYVSNLADVIHSSADQANVGSRGYRITLTGRTPLPANRASQLLVQFMEQAKAIADRNEPGTKKQQFPSMSVVYTNLEQLATYSGAGIGTGSRVSGARVSQPTQNFDEGGGRGRGRGDDEGGGRGRGRRGDEGRSRARAPRITIRPGQQVQQTAQQQIVLPDPLIPEESMVQDSSFQIVLVVKIQDAQSADNLGQENIE